MPHILIADDHAVTRRGLREILTDEFDHLQVEEAKDMQSTLDKVGTQNWDLLLMDIVMPGINIIEALGEIRKIRPVMPVLILTAVAETEYAIRTIKAGANGYINKQHASDELVKAVRRVMAGETYLSNAAVHEMATSLRDDIPADLPHQRLSSREMEVFQLIAEGKTVKEVAGELGVSDKTVGTYLGRIKEKTGLVSYVEIARYAMQYRLVE